MKTDKDSSKIKRQKHVLLTADSEIYALLITRHGPLMDIDELAEVMRRTKKSIQSAISSRHPELWAQALKDARIHHGRRVFFRTPLVAQILETDLPKSVKSTTTSGPGESVASAPISAVSRGGATSSNKSGM